MRRREGWADGGGGTWGIWILLPPRPTEDARRATTGSIPLLRPRRSPLSLLYDGQGCARVRFSPALQGSPQWIRRRRRFASAMPRRERPATPRSQKIAPVRERLLHLPRQVIILRRR